MQCAQRLEHLQISEAETYNTQKHILQQWNSFFQLEFWSISEWVRKYTTSKSVTQ